MNSNFPPSVAHHLYSMSSLLYPKRLFSPFLSILASHSGMEMDGWWRDDLAALESERGSRPHWMNIWIFPLSLKIFFFSHPNSIESLLECYTDKQQQIPNWSLSARSSISIPVPHTVDIRYKANGKCRVIQMLWCVVQYWMYCTILE